MPKSKNGPNSSNATKSQVLLKASCTIPFIIPMNVVVGGAGLGALNVLFLYPLVNITLRMHAGNPFRNFRGNSLYHGALGSSLFIIPATTLQFSVGRTLINYHESKENTALAISTKAACSVTGGVIAAPLLAPQEHVLTKLGARTHLSFMEMTTHLYKNLGLNLITAGLPAIAFRSGVCTVFFQTISPWVKTTAENNGFKPYTALFFACAGSGLAAAVVTQPADRIKYWQQNQSPLKKSAGEAAMEIYKGGGFSNFFAASTPRIVRATASVALAAFVNIVYPANKK